MFLGLEKVGVLFLFEWKASKSLHDFCIIIMISKSANSSLDYNYYPRYGYENAT